MKKLLTLFAIVLTCLTFSNNALAQAWTKDTKLLGLGFGASNFYHLDSYYYGNGNRVRNFYVPTTGQFNLLGEFGIHKYVGLGFTTGVGGRARWSRNYVGEVNIPIGMIANFHFYQLIADNASKNIHADKLDIYVGLNAGSGVAFTYYDNTSVRIVPLAFGGVHAGIRYYFVPNVGLNAELGMGKHLVNLGFVFKL